MTHFGEKYRAIPSSAAARPPYAFRRPTSCGMPVIATVWAIHYAMTSGKDPHDTDQQTDEDRDRREDPGVCMRPHVQILGLVGKDTRADVLHQNADEHANDAEPRAHQPLYDALPVASPSTLLMAQAEDREDEKHGAAHVRNIREGLQHGSDRSIGNRTT